MNKIIPQTKQCPQCNEEKRVSEFYVRKTKTKKDGIRSWCKKCEIENARTFRAENKSKVYSWAKKWAKENPDKRKRYDEEYRTKNREKIKAAQSLYRENNKDLLHQKNSAWKKNNGEKVLMYCKNRSAAKRNSFGKIDPLDWKALCDKYNNVCLCCKRSDVKLTVDHIRPLKFGGSNTIDNAQPLCASCNSKKGTKEIDYR